MDLYMQNERESQEQKKRDLFEGNTTANTINQDEVQRKVLLDDMVRNSTSSNAPVVKVLTNVHGKNHFKKKMLFRKLKIITFTVGGMGRLSKNLHNTNGFVQATHQEVLEMKANLSTMAEKLDSVFTMVQKATLQENMKGCDISEFFPVERNEQLELFMDRDHPDWNDRKAEFYNFLFTIASGLKKGFARGLIKALFTREYISTAKWPSFG